MNPRDMAMDAEQRASIPAGKEEQFDGYGIMALPFASGHLLGLRHFPSTNIGPGYTSVWHLAPDGRWTFYDTVLPLQACNRYYGSDVDEVHVTGIEVEWPAPEEIVVRIPSVGLIWASRLSQTLVTRALNAMATIMPEPLWRRREVLAMMGAVAGRTLNAGHMRLYGHVPNRQWFIANPRLIWLVDDATASIGGHSLGPLGKLPRQARLGDFWLPQRGILAFGRSMFEPFDAERHLAVATRMQT